MFATSTIILSCHKVNVAFAGKYGSAGSEDSFKECCQLATQAL
jgi:hypothetical protein